MKYTRALAASVALLSASSAMADIRINGFANMVGGYSNSEFETFGFSDSINFSNQSLFAVQLSGDVNEKVSATAQIVARGSDDFDARFEWAYMTYQATENFEIAAGRLRAPLFLYSESLDVGYSYHWVTAPNAVYGVQFNNIDGVRIRYSGYSNGWEYEAMASAGVINNPDENLSGENSALLSLQVGYENTKARIIYGRSTATLENPLVTQATAQIAPLDPELADLLLFSEDTGVFYGASISYDNFDWFASAEYTVQDIKDSFFPKRTAYYFTIGARFGKLTPSLTYQVSEDDMSFKFTDRVAALPAPFQPAVLPVVVGLQASQFEDYSISSLGLRYDYDAQIALKSEFMYVEDEIGSEDSVSMVRVAVNYVF